MSISSKLHIVSFMMQCVVFVSAETCLAQQDTSTQKYSVIAARYCQEKKYDLAILEIERAIQQENEVNEVYTWYIRGFIYKEVYKTNPVLGTLDPNRDIAVESFLKAKTLSNETANSNNDAALKYLAATYFNDALAVLDDDTSFDMQIADQLFSKYVVLMKELSLGQNMMQSQMEFHRAKGQRYIQLWKQDECNKNFAQSAIHHLSEAILIDPTDCATHYNLAVVYYGIGFNSNNDTPACWSREEISQNQVIALSSLLNAETTCDQSVEIKTALLNIYRFQQDKQNTLLYEQKLNSLILQNQSKH